MFRALPGGEGTPCRHCAGGIQAGESPADILRESSKEFEGERDTGAARGIGGNRAPRRPRTRPGSGPTGRTWRTRPGKRFIKAAEQGPVRKKWPDCAVSRLPERGPISRVCRVKPRSLTRAFRGSRRPCEPAFCTLARPVPGVMSARVQVRGTAGVYRVQRADAGGCRFQLGRDPLGRPPDSFRTRDWARVR